MRRLFILALLCVSPLLLVGLAHSQPVLPPLAAASSPGDPGTPVCAGPSMKRNSPDFYVGTMPDGSRMTLAWCPMVNDGEFAGWIRIQPADKFNAPIVWLTDTTPRPPAHPLFAVAANGASTTRFAYSSANGKIGAVASRVKVGTACDCTTLIQVDAASYCPFAGAPPSVVTVCSPVGPVAPMPPM